MTLLTAVPAFAEAQGEEPPTILDWLEWREVGPYRGGRSAAVAGIPSQPNTYYFGATGGGVWKTDDAGAQWENVSDGFFGGSIGAVAVSEWDPNVIYVGTGEKTVRGNVSHGDGVWKSTDAGRTWTFVGLADSRHVPRIRIHPKNPDWVYVAALGHLFGPNDERGVFRSKDGGTTWEKVLFVNENAGAIDLAMDPTNPRILYASFWRVRRSPWSLDSGGEGSGIWKSTDGGDTWKELNANPGLPKGTWGISGITVSSSQPDNVYAIIEAEEGGVFRSQDGGATWSKANEDRSLRQRAWYYSRIYADPADEEVVYVLNVQMHRSADGGRSFERIRTPHGDNHDLWIDPANAARMIESNDGGANVSNDGGATWSTQANQPTAQMYRVSVDNDFPYRLLGGQQDNSAVRIRHRSLDDSAIGTDDWEATAGGESGHVVAHPENPDVVYGGSYGGFLMRVDHDSGEARAVNVWPDDPMGWGAAELEFRFQWNYPLFFSPHDAGRLYAAANVLFASDDGGQSWRAISPDLTRNDKDKQQSSGGPITQDNTSVEYYSTIFAAVESPVEAGILWTGSDDGLVHVSRDFGANWANVTPPKLPEWTMINSIEADPINSGGLYVAATRYKLDDFTPYLFRTKDFGKTWARIDTGIERDHFTRVIRAVPSARGLLFAGTERGVYFSVDDGAHWRALGGGLPIVPVTDLAIKGGDLIAATQGRGYWILDDFQPLTLLADSFAESPEAVTLLPPRPTLWVFAGRAEEPRNRGTNPHGGVKLRYWLSEELPPETKLHLEIRDADGQVVREYERKPAEEAKSDGGGRGGRGRRNEGEAEDLRQLPSEVGANQFVWDLSYPPAEGFPGMILWNGRFEGATAIPGEYWAGLTVGEGDEAVTAVTTFEILADPRSSASNDDLAAQRDFLLDVGATVTRTHREIGRLRQVRGQIEDLQKRPAEKVPEAFREQAKALLETLDSVEKALYQTQNKSPQDPLNFPVRLNDKLAGLMGVASIGANRPTDSMLAVRDQLTEAIASELLRLETVWNRDLPALNALATELGITALALPEPKTDGSESKSLSTPSLEKPEESPQQASSITGRQ